MHITSSGARTAYEQGLWVPGSKILGVRSVIWETEENVQQRVQYFEHRFWRYILVWFYKPSSKSLCDVSWKSCYSSDLPRAVKTAENIYNGDITVLQGLREFNPMILFRRNYKLPFLLWAVLPRAKQLISNRCIDDYKKQIASCLNEILLESDEDILIVSHGFTMICLKAELKKRGFKGVNFKYPANGKLYIFESN